ncbi:MAG: hypothetical protein WC511_02810 [Candidatus Pacearchaeota archaeon]
MNFAEIEKKLTPEELVLFKQKLGEYENIFSVDVSTLSAEAATNLYNTLTSHCSAIDKSLIQLEAQIAEKEKTLQAKLSAIFKEYNITSMEELLALEKEATENLNKMFLELRAII